MKIPAKNMVISAFLTLAVGLFMQASAQNARAQSAASVSGTTWVGTDSDNDYYEYTFQADGALYYMSPSGFWKNGTWKQDGDSIYMETNNKYSEYQGRIIGTHIEGSRPAEHTSGFRKQRCCKHCWEFLERYRDKWRSRCVQFSGRRHFVLLVSEWVLHKRHLAAGWGFDLHRDEQ